MTIVDLLNIEASSKYVPRFSKIHLRDNPIELFLQKKEEHL